MYISLRFSVRLKETTFMKPGLVYNGNAKYEMVELSRVAKSTSGGTLKNLINVS